MATYKTSDFRKGLKVQIDGEPYLMTEMNFVKPGKGNALYKCKLRNLLRGTMLDRTYKGGDTLESADVDDIQTQYLYRQGEMFVFMDNTTYEQYELTAEQVDDNWKYLKEGMPCSMTLYNGNPITMAPPNHVELLVTVC
ncbi:MAG: elongation factor P, partial [Planctomycetales bacterium]|nr:elongation factor P [Planctomycetales bacterium]